MVTIIENTFHPDKMGFFKPKIFLEFYREEDREMVPVRFSMEGMMDPHEQKVREFESAYMGFLNMTRAFKNLNHLDHDPKPEKFGLSEQEAKFIRVRVERELGRTI